MADASTATGSVPVSMPPTVLPHWTQVQTPCLKRVSLGSVGVDEVAALRAALAPMREAA